jgi:phosphatidate cytidylyltransferase
MLWKRVLSSAVAIPVLLAAIWFDGPWYALIVAVVALLGLVEFYAMADLARLRLLTLFGTLWTLFFIFNAYYAPSHGSDTTLWLAVSGLIASALLVCLTGVVVRRRAGDQALIRWPWSVAGVLYMGLLLSYWILLMDSYGREWVLLALFSTFAVDTTAFFVGRAWGRRKLAPSISPGKTWEGAIGGLAGGVAAAFVLALILDVGLASWKVAFIGSLIGVSAQLGDLTESKLKRTVGVKEAGSIIPGHGGILDRLDSVVFTGVVVYYCLEWFVG